jgi:putative flippase GtrA
MARHNDRVTTAVASERSLREMVRVLAQFEGTRCLWRVPDAGVVFVLIRGLPIAAAMVIALVTVNGRTLQAVESAVIALAFDALAKTARARLPWRAIVANRLWTFEKPNPRTEVHILLRSRDVIAARTALRQPRLNPQPYGLQLGSPPPDAPHLNYRIAVQEPKAWTESSSDQNRVERIAGTLAQSGIEGRVGGIDVLATNRGVRVPAH